MKASERLENRRHNWRELDMLCEKMRSRGKRRLGGAKIVRFGALYRSACADLALAESYQLPPATVSYLHLLVGRAHNQLYRSKKFLLKTWAAELLINVPRRLYHDNCLRIAFVLFWGMFLISMLLASDYSPYPDYAQNIVPEEHLTSLQSSFSEPPVGRDFGTGNSMAGFYIMHNAGIGIRVFVWGLFFGVGGLYETFFNAVLLGVSFGYMTTVPESENFFHFVTAHGPFELTAIVLSAGAGMRLGWSLVDTQGYCRIASLRRAASWAMPTIGAAVILFILAAMIEAFISPSDLPYEVKAAVGAMTSGLLMFYFVLLGWPEGETYGVGVPAAERAAAEGRDAN